MNSHAHRFSVCFTALTLLLLGGCAGGPIAVGVWVQFEDTTKSFAYSKSFTAPDPAWRCPDRTNAENQVLGVPTWMECDAVPVHTGDSR